MKALKHGEVHAGDLHVPCGLKRPEEWDSRPRRLKKGL
jgi:hypothetical protein